MGGAVRPGYDAKLPTSFHFIIIYTEVVILNTPNPNINVQDIDTNNSNTEDSMNTSTMVERKKFNKIMGKFGVKMTKKGKIKKIGSPGETLGETIGLFVAGIVGAVKTSGDVSKDFFTQFKSGYRKARPVQVDGEDMIDLNGMPADVQELVLRELNK